MNFDESHTRLRKLQNFRFIFNYLIYKFYQPLFVLYGQVARISVLFTFHRFNFKDSAFFFYCACSVHLRMVLENGCAY